MADLAAHAADALNPHSVTKAQVGLGNADNTADADKPISTATQAALDAESGPQAARGRLERLLSRSTSASEASLPGGAFP